MNYFKQRLFLENQPEGQIEHYTQYLQILCSLSKLFSNSNIPYLYYRGAENAFCAAFNADNLSRSDCSVDARKDNMGIGLKTFLNGNGQSLQKVAEFNSERKNYSHLIEYSSKEFVYQISNLRNGRIQFTQRVHGIEAMIYHSVVRDKHGLKIYETPMDLIDIDSIRDIQKTSSSISFKDKYNDYTFNISKSTLLKRFKTPLFPFSLPATILDNPFSALQPLYQKGRDILDFRPDYPSVYLPLYSYRSGIKEVPEKSGLNQWHAGGRNRHPDEVYIPIPSWLHKDFEGFFPKRDEPFKLILPNKQELQAKVCQDNSKALMTNPNKDLGKWLLRDVLKLKEGSLLTYEMLEGLGIDSVRIDKIDSLTYSINFAETGSYEKFEDESKN